MSIYDFDVDIIAPENLPPDLRKPKQIAWLKVLSIPLQTLWNYFFVDYADGSNYPDYDIGLPYSSTDIVIYSNKKVYQCIKDAIAGIEPTDSVYWVLINDNFIGARERVVYNSRKIVLEYALNKWFRVPYSLPWQGADHLTQIWIENNNINGNFMLMGETGETSSAMSAQSINSTSFMGEAFTPNQYDFTIWVPIAVFNAQGSTDPNREQAIRNFADKYILAGIKYFVDTY